MNEEYKDAEFPARIEWVDGVEYEVMADGRRFKVRYAKLCSASDVSRKMMELLRADMARGGP